MDGVEITYFNFLRFDHCFIPQTTPIYESLYKSTIPQPINADSFYSYHKA